MAKQPATPAAKAPARKAPAKPRAAKPAAAAPAAPTNAIDISGHPMGEEFLEIVRLWVNPEGAISAFIRPRLKEPELFGRMLAQAARQGARAYAGGGTISEDEALKRIWAGIDGARAPAGAH